MVINLLNKIVTLESKTLTTTITIIESFNIDSILRKILNFTPKIKIMIALEKLFSQTDLLITNAKNGSPIMKFN